MAIVFLVSCSHGGFVQGDTSQVSAVSSTGTTTNVVHGATVPLPKTVGVDFNKHIDRTTTNAETLYIVSHGDPTDLAHALLATVTCPDSLDHCDIEPTHPLEPGHEYDLCIDGVRYEDLLFHPVTHTTFTTEADTTAPTVSSVTPVADTTGVSASVQPTVTFSEDMDSASFTTHTLALAVHGGAAVSESVAYDSATRTATLKPDSALSSQTTY
ncbi:MAG: Ig-like domain-containing protein, partial [Deltaproteobacteria bacterium]|nr:Ig-like domain-containing protein [Deltaproteobacteria bacterium]